jgi:hypothetical protein
MAWQAYQDFCHESSLRPIWPCRRFGPTVWLARRVSSGNRRASGLFFPAEIRTDIGASLAANVAGKQRLYVGQPDVIRPSVGAHGRRVAALVVRAIDQETANAKGAHLSEGDVLLAGEGRHAPMIPPI